MWLDLNPPPGDRNDRPYARSELRDREFPGVLSGSGIPRVFRRSRKCHGLRWDLFRQERATLEVLGQIIWLTIQATAGCGRHMGLGPSLQVAKICHNEKSCKD